MADYNPKRKNNNQNHQVIYRVWLIILPQRDIPSILRSSAQGFSRFQCGDLDAMEMQPDAEYNYSTSFNPEASVPNRHPSSFPRTCEILHRVWLIFPQRDTPSILRSSALCHHHLFLCIYWLPCLTSVRYCFQHCGEERARSPGPNALRTSTVR